MNLYYFVILSFCKWRLLTFILVTYYIVDIVYAYSSGCSKAPQYLTIQVSI